MDGGKQEAGWEKVDVAVAPFLWPLFPGQQHSWGVGLMESTDLWVDYPFPTFSSPLCSPLSDTPQKLQKYHLPVCYHGLTTAAKNQAATLSHNLQRHLLSFPVSPFEYVALFVR